MFDDLIKADRIRYSDGKRKKSGFLRIEYKESKYGHMPNVSDIAKKCHLTGPGFEPLVFICLSKGREERMKPKKDKMYNEEDGHGEAYENDSGIIGLPKYGH